MPRKVPNLTAFIPQPQEPQPKDLQNAIDTAQPKRLRLVLGSLCNSSVEAATISRTLLLVPEDEDDEEDFDSEEEISDQEDQFPEGFTWNCYEKPGFAPKRTRAQPMLAAIIWVYIATPGDADGCNTGPHAEEGNSHKRPRY